ncbi:WYL domain-containing protein [Brevibacillus centrosporus]|uniref:WYL domain-containing protein n=1 Tax=Brevibacillus centrosporus TaxID=54910 RepID=UPI003B011454
MIKELQRAISQHQHIQIIYLGGDGNTSQRILRPVEIAGDRLKVYCLTRRAPRVFNIENILAIQPVVIRSAV